MKTINEIKQEIESNKEKLIKLRELKSGFYYKNKLNQAADNRITNKIIFLKIIIVYLETCKVLEETLERDLASIETKISSIESKFDFWLKNQCGELPSNQKNIKHFQSTMGVSLLKKQVKTIKFILK